MLSEKEIQKICYDELRSMNLNLGCDDFINNLKNNDTSDASIKLQQIIHLSISRCLHAVLNEIVKK